MAITRKLGLEYHMRPTFIIQVCYIFVVFNISNVTFEGEILHILSNFIFLHFVFLAHLYQMYRQKVNNEV